MAGQLVAPGPTFCVTVAPAKARAPASIRITVVSRVKCSVLLRWVNESMALSSSFENAPRSDEFIRHMTNKFVTTWDQCAIQACRIILTIEALIRGANYMLILCGMSNRSCTETAASNIHALAPNLLQSTEFKQPQNVNRKVEQVRAALRPADVFGELPDERAGHFQSVQ